MRLPEVQFCGLLATEHDTATLGWRLNRPFDGRPVRTGISTPPIPSRPFADPPDVNHVIISLSVRLPCRFVAPFVRTELLVPASLRPRTLHSDVFDRCLQQQRVFHVRTGHNNRQRYDLPSTHLLGLVPISFRSMGFRTMPCHIRTFLLSHSALYRFHSSRASPRPRITGQSAAGHFRTHHPQSSAGSSDTACFVSTPDNIKDKLV